MLDLFQYNFIIRGFEAGIIIALIAPAIGIFLVLRRYSLIADTLSHVSLAGVALGLLLRINPLVTAIFSAVVSSVFIERLRLSKRIAGESALAIFLSGSLALAIILISFTNSVDLFNYLFGSISTVKQSDVYIIAFLGLAVMLTIISLYKELLYVTVDEEAAKVSGIPSRAINLILIILTALTVSLAIPIVGVLLIGALIVIPVVSALQFRKGFAQTIYIAELISVVSVITGIILSFYLNLSAGGVIVLVMILFLAGVSVYKKFI